MEEERKEAEHGGGGGGGGSVQGQDHLMSSVAGLLPPARTGAMRGQCEKEIRTVLVAGNMLDQAGRLNVVSRNELHPA